MSNFFSDSVCVWEPADLPWLLEGIESLTSLRRITADSLSFENGTVVTSEEDGGEPGSAFELVNEEGDESCCDYGTFEDRVPAEVTLPENGKNDDPGHDSDDEFEEEDDNDEEESDEEDNDDDDDSANECETNGEGSVESVLSRVKDSVSCRSARFDSGHGSPCWCLNRYASRRHELFLPLNVSPSTESLKYEEISDESSDEDDVPYFYRRTSMIGRSGRPMLRGGCPSGISVSSNSSASEDGPQKSKKRKGAEKRSVSFSNSVTVYPVFRSTAYPPSVVERMYTKREELRINKIRKKKEFAHDMYDWRNATEEDGMETNEEGELVHPVHCAKKGARALSPRSDAQACSSMSGDNKSIRTNDLCAFHRGKRMRMF